MKRYYITGISGFLGRNIVLLLKKQGNVKIIGLVHSLDKAVSIYEDDPDVTLIEGDVCDKESLARFMDGADEESYLIHAAARVSLYAHLDKKTTEVNVNGTVNVIEEALKHPFVRMVHVSSVDALFQTGEGIVYAPDHYEEKSCPGVYGKSKAAASNRVIEACKEKGLPAIIVCPSALVGPDDPYIGPMNDALLRFCKGKIPVMTPGGYDVADVRDVAEGILSALEKGKVGESYILCGHRLTVKELFGTFGEVYGRKLPKLTLPWAILHIVAPFAEFFARITRSRPMFSPLAVKLLHHNPHYDRSKAEKDLGYNSRDIKESAIDMIQWAKENKILN